MDRSIFTYIGQLEMLAFFSGYPMVYYLIRFFIRRASLKNVSAGVLVSILPFAYALTGTIYLGLQVINLYSVHNIENIRHRIQQPYLIFWALLSLLFWIPAISKRQILSVFHGLVFFFIIIKDIYFQLTELNPDRNILRNDMKLYTVSIFLNLAAFILLSLPYCLQRQRKKYPEP